MWHEPKAIGFINIFVIGPLECGCHFLTEGVLFLCLSFLLYAGGVWWLAGGATGPAQTGSLSHPQTRNQPVVLLCSSLRPLDCDKFKLCVWCCVWQTPFFLLSYWTTAICEVVWFGRRKMLFFFSTSFFYLLFMERKTGKINLFYFLLEHVIKWILISSGGLFVILAMSPLTILIRRFFVNKTLFGKLFMSLMLCLGTL